MRSCYPYRVFALGTPHCTPTRTTPSCGASSETFKASRPRDNSTVGTTQIATRTRCDAANSRSLICTLARLLTPEIPRCTRTIHLRRLTDCRRKAGPWARHHFRFRCVLATSITPLAPDCRTAKLYFRSQVWNQRASVIPVGNLAQQVGVNLETLR